MNQTTLLLVCLIGTICISIITSIITASIVSRKKTYKGIIKILKNSNKIKSYKEVVGIISGVIENNSNEHTKINNYLEEIKINKRNNISKISSLKYDSTPDSGGKMSFSLAMLNENNSGIVLTNIYMREGSFLYLREITEGKCDIELSDEEKKVVNKTIIK